MIYKSPCKQYTRSRWTFLDSIFIFLILYQFFPYLTQNNNVKKTTPTPPQKKKPPKIHQKTKKKNPTKNQTKQTDIQTKQYHPVSLI